MNKEDFEKRIKDLETEKANFIAQAQVQMGVYEGRLQELRQMGSYLDTPKEEEKENKD